MVQRAAPCLAQGRTSSLVSASSLTFFLAFLSLSLCTKKKTMQLVKAVSCNFHTSPVQPSLALLHSPVIRCFTFPLPTKTCGATSVGAKACKLAGGALGRKHILATSLFPFLFLFATHLPSPVSLCASFLSAHTPWPDHSSLLFLHVFFNFCLFFFLSSR